MPSISREFILTLSCRDAKGIVYAVSGPLYQAGCNIIDSQQFGDVQSVDATGLFFMRAQISSVTADLDEGPIIDQDVERAVRC